MDLVTELLIFTRLLCALSTACSTSVKISYWKCICPLFLEQPQGCSSRTRQISWSALFEPCLMWSAGLSHVCEKFGQNKHILRVFCASLWKLLISRAGTWWVRRGIGLKLCPGRSFDVAGSQEPHPTEQTRRAKGMGRIPRRKCWRQWVSGSVLSQEWSGFVAKCLGSPAVVLLWVPMHGTQSRNLDCLVVLMEADLLLAVPLLHHDSHTSVAFPRCWRAKDQEFLF